jgi:Holin of 3TMs, for gene-transfer release
MRRLYLGHCPGVFRWVCRAGTAFLKRRCSGGITFQRECRWHCPSSVSPVAHWHKAPRSPFSSPRGNRGRPRPGARATPECNITAETKSEDPYVRRARPTFLYVIMAAMAYSLIVAPTINACLHKGLVAMQIPDSYLELFGVAFLGYTGARSWEKTKGLD